MLVLVLAGFALFRLLGLLSWGWFLGLDATLATRALRLHGHHGRFRLQARAAHAQEHRADDQEERDHANHDARDLTSAQQTRQRVLADVRIGNIKLARVISDPPTMGDTSGVCLGVEDVRDRIELAFFRTHRFAFLFGRRGSHCALIDVGRLIH